MVVVDVVDDSVEYSGYLVDSKTGVMVMLPLDTTFDVRGGKEVLLGPGVLSAPVDPLLDMPVGVTIFESSDFVAVLAVMDISLSESLDCEGRGPDVEPVAVSSGFQFFEREVMVLVGVPVPV